MTGGSRQDLWRGAELLEALIGPDQLPPRYRGWTGRAPGPRFDWDDVVAAANWPAKDPPRLPAYLRCIGAAVHASAWRSILDGQRLRGLAAAVSPSLLDAVLDLDPLCIPAGPQTDEAIPDGEALADLGRRLLLATLPGAPLTDDTADLAQACAAVEAGAMLLARVGAQHE